MSGNIELKENYLAWGLQSHAIHFHPDDRRIFDEQVFRDIREFWSHIPAREIQNYRFSFNQRHFREDDGNGFFEAGNNDSVHKKLALRTH